MGSLEFTTFPLPTNQRGDASFGIWFYFVVLPLSSPSFSNSFVSSMQENTLRINWEIALPPLDCNHRACIIFLPKASAPGVAHIITWEYWQNFSKKNATGLLCVHRGPYFPGNDMILEISSEFLSSQQKTIVPSFPVGVRSR